uniref:Aquaporin n=1 Tax=Macrostomum lignano TaxID=282301 RepID=A0A1I8HQC7_9PLAT
MSSTYEDHSCSCSGITSSRNWHMAMSELLGTFLLVSLGLSAAATAALSAPATAQLGSGLALVVALYVTMGASGGHINPAVSTALFAVKRMSLADFLLYQTAQYTGGLLAAALVCCFFYPPLLDFETAKIASSAVAGNAGNITEAAANVASTFAAHSAAEQMEAIYVTHAHQSVSLWRALSSEVFATGSFILAVRGITDNRNAGPPLYLQPPMIAATVLALTLCTAPLSGCSLNPARDLPSRIVVAVFQLAVDGCTTGLFSLGGSSSFVAPLIGPYLGAAVGSWLYELCITRGLKASLAAANDQLQRESDGKIDPKDDLEDSDDLKETRPNGDSDNLDSSEGPDPNPNAADSKRRRQQPRKRVATKDTELSLLESSEGKSRDVSVVTLQCLNNS